MSASDDHREPLTPAQRAELESRLARFEDDKDAAIDWEGLKAELLRGSDTDRAKP